MRIAIDAMGGDHAPTEIIAGTLLAAARWPDTDFVLFGDRSRLEGHFSGGAKPINVHIENAPEVIEMDDDPARAVRRKPQSSLVRACADVAEQRAQAVFSAGNTGAVSAAALFGIGRIEGVSRPAIAVVLPARNKHGKTVVCDAGANVDCKPEWLVQFAVMASMYAEGVEGIAAPRVGLLNIGEEACKGNALSKAAHALLAESGLNWQGNLEAKHVMDDLVDVIACDGFDGNLVLKLAEGMAGYMMGLVKDSLTANWRAKLGALLARPGLLALKRRIDYAEYGGAVLLGVKGLVIIGHGCSDRRAVVSALARAREGISSNLVGRMSEYFATTEAA